MQQFHTQEYPAANRNYKDRLFRFVFKNKKDLLDLYNAINGTDYDNPEELEVNTLENVLYLSMKNDLSFLIDAELNLYEHQSTYPVAKRGERALSGMSDFDVEYQLRA